VMDTSSRTSAALVRVLCARLFKIEPAIEAHSPDLNAMLDRGDAALIIGDNALVWDGRDDRRDIQKIDLGEEWTAMTGLPFVWAFWAGPAGVVSAEDITALQTARDAGIEQRDAIAREYFSDRPQHRDLGMRYLRDNIKYYLAGDERAGLELFYRYAAEIGIVHKASALRFHRPD
jgi:chorismate dehydratase